MVLGAVAEVGHVGAEQVEVLVDELVQTGAVALLAALKEELEVDRQLAVFAHVELRRAQVRAQRALVVGRSAAVHFAVDDGGFEGRCAPAGKVAHGLHVVVRVNQDGFLGRIVAERTCDDGIGLDLVTLRVDADLTHPLYNIIAAFAHAFAAGTDRRTANQVAQAVDHFLLMSVHVTMERGFEIFHVWMASSQRYTDVTIISFEYGTETMLIIASRHEKMQVTGNLHAFRKICAVSPYKSEIFSI